MNLHLRHNLLSINPVDLLVNQVKKLVDLSDIIRMRRGEMKLTQENVAFELGCDPATYNRWEKDGSAYPSKFTFGSSTTASGFFIDITWLE